MEIRGIPKPTMWSSGKEDDMVRFIGALRIRQDRIQDVERAIKQFMPHVREEEGTLEYVVYRAVQDPTKIVFYERYRDAAALKAHGGEPLRSMKEVLLEAVDGEPFTGTFEELASK